MQSVRENSINLCGLKCSRLFKCQISRSSQIIVKNVIVKLQLTIDLKEFTLPILQKSLLKFLYIDICKFLVNLWIVNVDSILAQIIQHVLILVQLLLELDVAFLALQFF